MAWAPYAQARGLRHSPGRTGWAHEQWPRLDGVVENIQVAFELVERAQGFNSAAIAVPPAALEGHVEVTREGVLAKITKLFGAQDIVLGREAFDRAFLVRGTSKDTVSAVLRSAVQDEMLAIGVVRLAYDDGSEHQHVPTVVLELPQIVTDWTWLDRALALVVDIARVRAQDTPYR
jgi:hypothetical protein